MKSFIRSRDQLSFHVAHRPEKLRALRAAGAAVDAMLAKAQASEAEIDAIALEFASARKVKRGNRPH
jgi:hypothetical protein